VVNFPLKTPVVPALGNTPEPGNFDESSILQHDDKRSLEPLPREWAHYEADFINSNDRVIHLLTTVGKPKSWKLFGLETLEDQPYLPRTLKFSLTPTAENENCSSGNFCGLGSVKGQF